ncbi:UNVERIFIED_ORG: cytochrome c oxidase cbb3-type subunit 3 [Rhizobium esperanzae]
MPRWWIWTFYVTILWAIGYAIAYPAIPMITSATNGYLGYSTRAELQQDLNLAKSSQTEFHDLIAAKTVEEIDADPALRKFAIAGGASAFKVNCAPCHGSGASGGPGFPNLNDDDWLWGGDLNAIQATISHGIRFDGDTDSHSSEMPPFAGVLEPIQMKQVAAFVWGLTNTPSDVGLAAAGKQVFFDNCAPCHGEDAKGKVEMGAPDLADAIWLKSRGEDAILRQVASPKHGVMPAWAARLGDTTVNELTIFVHALGGGT